jgi:type II secretory pathway pseudopilin PulG
MPTGERRHPLRRQSGFSYLLLLFVLVLGGAALAAVGERWQLRAQQEREDELLSRGLEMREALQRYAAATPAGRPKLPRSLDELLEDRRGPEPRHWLRQLYPDPGTGEADWQLLRDAEGGIVGLHSRSRRPALRRHGLPVTIAPGAAASPRVGDWQFLLAGREAAAGTTEGGAP